MSAGIRPVTTTRARSITATLRPKNPTVSSEGAIELQACDGDPAKGRFVPVDATERRGPDDRSGSLGSQGEICHAGRDRGRGAHRRSPRRVRAHDAGWSSGPVSRPRTQPSPSCPGTPLLRLAAARRRRHRRVGDARGRSRIRTRSACHRYRTRLSRRARCRAAVGPADDRPQRARSCASSGARYAQARTVGFARLDRGERTRDRLDRGRHHLVVDDQWTGRHFPCWFEHVRRLVLPPLFYDAARDESSRAERCQMSLPDSRRVAP